MPSSKLRVTRRVESKPDRRGRKRLVAREGEEVTAEQAERRGVPTGALAPVDGTEQVQVTRDVKVHEGRGRMRLVAREGQTMSVEAAQARGIPEDAYRSLDAGDAGDDDGQADDTPDAGEDGDEEFPKHLGGPNWRLSDGSTVQGNRERAEEAEADLHDDEDDDGEDA